MYEFHQGYAREETASVHILAVWSHPSGVIMNRTTPILRPADAAGRSVRVPTVVMGEVFRSAGANTLMNTAPQVVKLLQDGAIDGSLFVYELVPTLKLGDYIRHISEFAGHRGFYTSVFFLAMNKDSYASLDADLRKVLDDNTGPSLSRDLGRAWDEIEEVGRDAFTLAGGEVTFVRGEDYEDWVKASEPAIESWKARVGRIGIDGDKLIAVARELVAKYTARAHND
jgi:TRAP-type C4-dicarboxylate transport system substrate-binding protein